MARGISRGLYLSQSGDILPYYIDSNLYNTLLYNTANSYHSGLEVNQVIILI